MRTTPTWARPSTTWPYVYRAQGKYSEAEGLFERALAIREKALGASHPDVGQTLNNLANLYRDQGKYGEAEGLFKRALAIREQALGASHPDVAATLMIWPRQLRGKAHRRGGGKSQWRDLPCCGSDSPQPGPGLLEARQVQRGGGLYKRALAIREQALGASHPDVAQTVNNLALVYQDQGKYGEAEGLFKRALAIRETALGAKPPRRGRRASTIWRSLYRAQGKYSGGGGALQARVGDQGAGARCEPPRRGPDPQQPGKRVSRPGQVRGGGGALQARAWRSAKTHRARTTQTWPGPSLIWHCFIGGKADTETRRRSTSARWQSESRSSERATPRCRRPQQPGPRLLDARQVQRGGGTLQARVGDQREGAGRESPRRGPDPQRPERSCIETRASTGRRRGSSSARLVDPRTSARCEPPRRGPEPEQLGLTYIEPRASTGRRKSSSSARWRSGSRLSVRSHPDVAHTLAQPSQRVSRPGQVR